MRAANALRVGAFGLFLWACGVLTDAPPPPTAAPCQQVPPEAPEQDIELRPVKEVFAAGEPIALQVVIRNRTALPLELYGDCPLLKLEGGPPPVPPALADAEAGPFTDGTTFVLVFVTRLGPGETHIGTAYLQTFLRPPAPGGHRIKYHAWLEASSADPTLEGGGGQRLAVPVSLRGTGRLRFAVRPAAPGELERIAAQYAARLHEWDRGGLDALALMDDRFVLPHLPRLATRPYHPDETRAVLRRFAHNEEARAMLRRALAGANEQDASWLLGALADWKCDVDVALLRRLFRSGIGLRSAVQDYARKLGKPQYAEFLPRPDDGPA